MKVKSNMKSLLVIKSNDGKKEVKLASGKKHDFKDQASLFSKEVSSLIKVGWILEDKQLSKEDIKAAKEEKEALEAERAAEIANKAAEKERAEADAAKKEADMLNNAKPSQARRGRPRRDS